MKEIYENEKVLVTGSFAVKSFYIYDRGLFFHFRIN